MKYSLITGKPVDPSHSLSEGTAAAVGANIEAALRFAGFLPAPAGIAKQVTTAPAGGASTLKDEATRLVQRTVRRRAGVMNASPGHAAEDTFVIDLPASIREVPGTAAPRAAQPAAQPRKAEPAQGFIAVSGVGLEGRLFLPRPNGRPPALLVMLHGCTQGPEDFATGTRMNALAEADGMAVLYPEQSAGANGQRCWNWFRPEDQGRRGEPDRIAALTRQVLARHGLDGSRVYVAGLSAGAAMAVILGESYPELFVAVGAHSGLPAGVAHDLGSALGAMKGTRVAQAHGHAPAKAAASRAPVPTIVFHGDRDHTVHADNSAAIVAAALQGHSHAGATLAVVRESGEAGGRRYTLTRHVGSDGQSRVEQWELHGAGHAWSGGSASGSYVDERGPDASAAMLAFFRAQRRA